MSEEEITIYPGNELPAPGTCQRCGASNRDCIDLGFDIEDKDDDLEDEGFQPFRLVALMCMQCFDSMAKLVGYIEEPIDDPVERVTDNYEEKLRQARLKANELFDVLDSVSAYIPAIVEPFGEHSTGNKGSKSKEGSGTSETREQVSESSFSKRSDGVSSNSSNGSIFE